MPLPFAFTFAVTFYFAAITHLDFAFVVDLVDCLIVVDLFDLRYVALHTILLRYVVATRCYGLVVYVRSVYVYVCSAFMPLHTVYHVATVHTPRYLPPVTFCRSRLLRCYGYHVCGSFGSRFPGLRLRGLQLPFVVTFTVATPFDLRVIAFVYAPVVYPLRSLALPRSVVAPHGYVRLRLHGCYCGCRLRLLLRSFRCLLDAVARVVVTLRCVPFTGCVVTPVYVCLVPVPHTRFYVYVCLVTHVYVAYVCVLRYPVHGYRTLHVVTLRYVVVRSLFAFVRYVVYDLIVDFVVTLPFVDLRVCV